MKKNAFYAQSGGVTSVINATAAALILESKKHKSKIGKVYACLLYTSPSPRDAHESRMPSSA